MAAKYPEDAFTPQRPDGQQRFQHLSGLPDGEAMIPECEVVLEGEGDLLETRHKNCPKNPGHANFIPASQFTMAHIPPPLRTQENMALIRQKIDRTVRIRVAYTSLHRPDVFSDSKVPYPYAPHRGNTKAVRYGTGGIHRLLTRHPIKDKACPCHLCVASGNPEKEHWRLTIRTATHVIYDNSEAELATFDCFFDSKDDTTGVKTLYGLCIDQMLTSQDDMYKSDHVEIICVTHDIEVVDRLFNTRTNDGDDDDDDNISSETRMHVPHMFTSELPPEGVVVSHPHGCSKRVTFGNVHYITVPVKPMYATSTPISFPCGTECRLNPIGCSAAADEKVSLFVSFVQGEEFTHSQGTDIPYINTGDKTFKTTDKNALDENVSTNNLCINNTACKTTNNNALDENVLTNKAHINSDVSCTQNHPRNQSDDGSTETWADKIKTLLNFKKGFGAVLSFLNTSTHTLEQYTGEELVDQNYHSTPQLYPRSFVDLRDAFGVDAETIMPVLDTLKGSFSNLTEKRTHDQQRSECNMIEMIKQAQIKAQSERNDHMTGKRLKQSLQPVFEKPNDVNSSETGAISRFDNVEISDEVDDDDISSDESVSDTSEGKLQAISKVFDGKLRSILDCTGFEHLFFNNRQFDGSPPKPKDVLHGDSFDVPMGVEFMLPPKSAFAMRYYKESPGWFSFPPGTKVTNPVGNTTVSLPEGAEFRNPAFHPEYSFITYDMDTCPGSSGAPVYSNLLGNKYTTCFPHSGSTRGRLNMSAVNENQFFPIIGKIWNSLFQAFHYNNNRYSINHSRLENLGIGAPKGSQDEAEPRKMSDLDLD